MTTARTPTTVPAFDAIVLAGGTARRLGGVSKPDVLLAGRRLLDHALAATTGAGRVVVVAPPSVEVPAGVARTLEDPPHGGPVAGIAAGLAALAAMARLDGDRGPAGAAGDGGATAAPLGGPRRAVAPLLLVLSCDVPRAAGAVPRLLAAASTSGGDGACLADGSGHLQWLVGAYRTASLRRRLDELGADVRGASVRALTTPLTLAAVPATGLESADVDTWADLAALDAPERPGGSGP
ncbi:molybdenum cofactor guanylyltransferase [Georgenia sp. SYP-B2076]|uniref:molybdenum cofactor guanylyltransferase n=1 Tax=Georgenia sp. SYP-B2076 TaxID=2495881 RepID=UPI000F8CA136|nr:NTP transferase domain-containing protein [Georgenia sp. SYP-B2076]